MLAFVRVPGPRQRARSRHGRALGARLDRSSALQRRRRRICGAALAATARNSGFGQFITVDLLHFCLPKLTEKMIGSKVISCLSSGADSSTRDFLENGILTEFFIYLYSSEFSPFNP
jgi:hypothetical protein